VKEIQTFAEFWPFYLGEHAKPATRALHITGSTAAVACAVAAIALRSPWLVLLGVALGYAFAWIGHFFVERNRPASFRYPLWSFIADWKMWAYAVTGRLERELQRTGVTRSIR
jgi:hypothetical protein